jgi:hypothetical protein
VQYFPYEKIGEGKLSTYTYTGGELDRINAVFVYYGAWVLDDKVYSSKYSDYVDVDGIKKSFTPSLEVGSYYYIYREHKFLIPIYATKTKPNWWDNPTNE